MFFSLSNTEMFVKAFHFFPLLEVLIDRPLGHIRSLGDHRNTWIPKIILEEPFVSSTELFPRKETGLTVLADACLFSGGTALPFCSYTGWGSFTIDHMRLWV